MTYSTTVAGKTITPKYLAPERDFNQPCGRSEDIFSLGCILLKIVFQLAKPYHQGDRRSRPPWFTKGWLYSSNIEEAKETLTFCERTTPHLAQLAFSVLRMLEVHPRSRPKINDILTDFQYLDAATFFGACCMPDSPSDMDSNKRNVPRDRPHISV